MLHMQGINMWITVAILHKHATFSIWIRDMGCEILHAPEVKGTSCAHTQPNTNTWVHAPIN